MTGNPNIAFVICTESGPIEQMSTLLALTLRRFGGGMSNAAVYSYAPRIGRDIGATTREWFSTLRVHHQHIPVNTEFPDYPLANKPLVAAYAEQSLKEDVIVFVDSDMLILAEPAALLIPDGYDVAVRPVDVKGIGVSSEEDEEYPYWDYLYDVCGATERTYVKTTLRQKRILGYWNSGLVASRRCKGIFSRWADNFAKVMSGPVKPKRGGYFVEQSTLAGSIVAAGARIYEMAGSYNYPIHLHHRMINPERIERESELVTAHYHRMFRLDGKYARKNPISSILGSGEKSRWLIEQLDAFGIYPSSYWKRVASNQRDRLIQLARLFTKAESRQ